MEGEAHPVAAGALREDAGHAAQELGEDRAGVPRAPMRAPWAMARTASAAEGTEVPVSWAAKTASTAAAADSTVR